MKVPLTQLPKPIYGRLQKVQRSPQEFAGYYAAEGGKGCAIFGLIVASIAFFTYFAMASSGEEMGLVAWIAALVIPLWIATASVDHIRRYNRAPLKSFLFLNPLYLTRVNLDEVTYYNIWKDQKDFQRTDNYNNGIYTGSDFTFTFDEGVETINVSPKDKADELSQTLQQYAQLVVEAVEQENFEALGGHDLFFELEHDPKRPQGGNLPEHTDQSAPKKRPNFIAAVVLAGVLGFGFHTYNEGNYHRKIVKHYKDRLERSKTSANKLRKIMKVKNVKPLPQEMSDELVKHIREEGSKALDKLYVEAIEKYETKSSKKGNKQARTAMIEVLKAAKNKGWYQVQVHYKGTRSKSIKYKKVKSPRGMDLLPLGPAFTDKHNHRREAFITNALKTSFAKIIPQDILSFSSDSETGAVKKGAGKTKKKSKKSVEVSDKGGDQAPKVASKVEFEITYQVSPRYHYNKSLKRNIPSIYYIYKPVRGGKEVLDRSKPAFRGMQFSWQFTISVDGKKIYQFVEVSTPPISVDLGKSSSSASDMDVYDRMAQTAFYKFGQKLVKRFGVETAKPKATPRRPLNRPKMDNKRRQELIRKYRERLRKQREERERRRREREKND